MVEEEEVDNPIELLRQLIEKSGRWTEESVVYVRLILFYLASAYALFLYFMYRWINDSISNDKPLLIPVVLTVGITINNAWVLVKVIQTYKKRIARRDNWRKKFIVLRQKEEEIEKLLAEGAG